MEKEWTAQDQQILDSLYNQTPTGQFFNFLGDVWPLIVIGLLVWYFIRRSNKNRKIQEQILQELKKKNGKRNF